MFKLKKTLFPVFYEEYQKERDMKADAVIVKEKEIIASSKEVIEASKKIIRE